MAFVLPLFPPEVLCNITDYLRGSDVGRLWICGNAVLCSKLQSGGVAKLEVEAKYGFPSFWPRLVSEFPRLRHLCLDSEQGFDEHALERYLAALSPTVRHLALESSQLQLSWFTDRVASSIANLTSLKLSLDTVLSTSKHLRLPAHLETLQCGILNASLLSELPLRLTSLTIELSNDKVAVDCLSRFKALKDLSIWGWNHPRVTALPPALTLLRLVHCRLGGNNSDFRFPSTLQTIIARIEIPSLRTMPPPSLTHLDLHEYTNGGDLGGIDLKSIKLLPPTLRYLRMADSVRPRDLIHLPASLTHLQCPMNGPRLSFFQEPVVDPSVQPRCPPNLTTFLYHSPFDVLPFPILPDCLKTFEWAIWEVGPTTWPKEIQSFKSKVSDESTDWDDEQCLFDIKDMLEYRETQPLLLPPTITHLDLFFVNPTQLYLLLPSSLTYLVLDCDTTEQLRVPPSDAQRAAWDEEPDQKDYDPMDDYDRLPPVNEEKEQEFYELQFPEGWALLLPTTLTELIMNIPHRCLDDQWVDDLNCPQLRTLSILNTVEFSAAKIPCLPLSIEDLTLKLKYSIDWIQIELHKRKPLRTLDISSQTEFTSFPTGNDEILQTLPPRLISLKLRNSPLSQEQKRFLFERHHIDADSDYWESDIFQV